MSQMLQLDALVTMLACLTTTQNDLGSQMIPLTNSTTESCPLSTFSGLTTRIQTLSTEIASFKEKISDLQEQLVDLRRSGAPRIISTPAVPRGFSSRIYEAAPRTLAVAASPSAAILPGKVGLEVLTSEPSTPLNCLKQQHGVVRIRPRANIDPFFVFCDQKTRGGGWTVVVNRFDGSEDFNRKWADYKIGFGPLTAEFFLGLEKLHQISSSEDCELLVQLENRKQEPRYAIYDHFSIGGESEQYRLNVLGKYQGDASDAMRQHTGKKFSTFDKDNDESESNCAVAQSAAFWYGNSCTLSNPFGLYQRLLERDVDSFKGILWRGFLDGPKGSLKRVRMLLRPRSTGKS
ncbi:LOW QUALITY PROTEIN: microfibril-associated glycoprotein 4 [Drosophila nasuta]|uniref:LOW QUALITY PROTEIN: microfibril-associated glycoprotein 4 n=1 Tax=Drosophila nasuta TaxID=42062 RepID=UPI00295EB8A4|nr:LOW QUALITY PROTEIN: microfibril-associated glycoprotein 4 [Drosophila nasuta]